jgi:hypothetical protein
MHKRKKLALKDTWNTTSLKFPDEADVRAECYFVTLTPIISRALRREKNMQSRVHAVSWFLVIGLFSSFLTVGCASFPGKELPTYTYDNVTAPAAKLTASYDVKALVFDKENERSAGRVQEEIQKVLQASPLFEKIAPGAGTGEYQCSFLFKNEGNQALAAISGFISGFTFTIIPAYARDKFVLTVDVKRGDRLLKTYVYRDHIDSWIQLLLVFLAPSHWPPDISKEVFDNMLMNFLHDFSKDLNAGVLVAAQGK